MDDLIALRAQVRAPLPQHGASVPACTRAEGEGLGCSAAAVWLAQVNELVDVKTSVNDFIIKACAKSLMEVRQPQPLAGLEQRYTALVHATLPHKSRRPRAVTGTRVQLELER